MLNYPEVIVFKFDIKINDNSLLNFRMLSLSLLFLQGR